MMGIWSVIYQNRFFNSVGLQFCVLYQTKALCNGHLFLFKLPVHKTDRKRFDGKANMKNTRKSWSMIIGDYNFTSLESVKSHQNIQ